MWSDEEGEEALIVTLVGGLREGAQRSCWGGCWNWSGHVSLQTAPIQGENISNEREVSRSTTLPINVNGEWSAKKKIQLVESFRLLEGWKRHKGAEGEGERALLIHYSPMRPIILVCGVELLSKPSMLSYSEWEIRRSWLSSREFEGCSLTGGLPGATYRNQERWRVDMRLENRCSARYIFHLVWRITCVL